MLSQREKAKKKHTTTNKNRKREKVQLNSKGKYFLTKGSHKFLPSVQCCSGVSIIIEVASSCLNRVPDCINKGRVNPMPLGESWGMLSQKILKFQSPKMQFPAFWGLN